MHSWDQMKPRTVYEKAVQDFTETARQLARLNQHFRQASFAEFEMLMGFDDEALKRYGLPPSSLLIEHDGLIRFEERPLDHRLRAQSASESLASAWAACSIAVN
jgi:hypothetical protein